MKINFREMSKAMVVCILDIDKFQEIPDNDTILDGYTVAWEGPGAMMRHCVIDTPHSGSMS